MGTRKPHRDRSTSPAARRHEYVYDNMIGRAKAFNSSEIIALNDHQFLIWDTRDGKGLGDGSTAVVKRIYKIDLAGADRRVESVG